MTNERLLVAIQQLPAIARREADTEARLGPAWIHDQSLTAIDTLVEMEQAALRNKLVLAPGFSFYERLGTSWVDLSEDIYTVVQRIDAELKRASSAT